MYVYVALQQIEINCSTGVIATKKLLSELSSLTSSIEAVSKYKYWHMCSVLY